MTALPESLIARPADGRNMIQRPARGTGRPFEPRSADPLSAVLRAVRLRGAVYFLVDASSPWALKAPPGRMLAPTLMPSAQHLIEYHVVKRGTCFGGLVGRAPLGLGPGDVIVFPQGDAHFMAGSPAPRHATRTGSDDVAAMLRLASPPFPMRTGGGGSGGAEIVCGFLGCDMRPFNPLIATLPRVLHVRAEESNTHLNALIELTLAEAAAPRAGGEATLARLSELMFIEIVRRHLQTLPEGTGWLSGLRDPVVGRALSLLHGDPSHAWTIEGLARAAHLSRSALAERFRRFTGLPPMQYLAQWRMQLAAGMLSEGQANVAAVASEVGYGSEAAFSRAFKRLVGLSPSDWREHGER
jgi:AraC-like DNA-binding protein